jgi:hypothetical protein
MLSTYVLIKAPDLCASCLSVRHGMFSRHPNSCKPTGSSHKLAQMQVMHSEKVVRVEHAILLPGTM